MRRVPLALFLALSGPAWAVPLQLGQSGRFVDAEGEPLEGVHEVTFGLYDVQSGGTPVWLETQPLALDRGYFHTLLGTTTGNTLDSALFDGRALWIEVGVPDLGVVLGRQPIASVPYAIRAGWATNLEGGEVDASVIKVDGQTIVDAEGNIVGGGVALEEHTHTAADVGAAEVTHTHSVGSLGAAAAVHTHSLAALGAAADGHVHTAAEVGASASGHAHTAAEVGASPDTHSHTLGDLGAAADDHVHSAADVGAAADDHGHTPAEVGAAADDHTHTAGDLLTALDGQDLDLGAGTTLDGAALAALLPPVGAILAYAADPALLPGSWVPCDGRTIADPHPSLRDFGAAAGVQVPNLTDSRFLMGTTYGNLGATGGTNAIATDGGHIHGVYQTPAGQDLAPDASHYNDGTGFYEAGAHNHGGDNRPAYLGVLYIVRIE